MFDTLLHLPDHIREAVSIGEHAPTWSESPASNRYAVFGLGGSAVGADLLRSYAAATEGLDKLQITVSRGYTAPGWLDADTRVVCSSYSGETEETLSAYDAARKKSKRTLCLTTGGTLAEKAAKHKVPVVFLPSGFQPRCALPFSFFPLLTVMGRSGAWSASTRKRLAADIDETVKVVKKLAEVYAEPSTKNPAYALAKGLKGAYPVIYSASERLDVVNVRWRGQIQENAKQVAFGNLLPEMNHNEINGWMFPKGGTKSFKVMHLRDVDDHPRVALRFEALRDIIKKNVGSVIDIQGTGKSLLARTFSLVYLGDWMSWHLAILNGVDPSPVPVIQSLKRVLAGK